MGQALLRGSHEVTQYATGNPKIGQDFTSKFHQPLQELGAAVGVIQRMNSGTSLDRTGAALTTRGASEGGITLSTLA